ncbi:MAG: O-antigen ligase family protein [Haloplanus sp.]
MSRQTVGATILAYGRESALYRWATARSEGFVSIHLGGARFLPESLLAAVASSTLLAPIIETRRSSDILMVALIASLPLGSYEVALFSLPDVLLLLTSGVLGLQALRRRRLRVTAASLGTIAATTGLLLWMSVSIALTNASPLSLTQPIGHWLLLVVIVLYVDDTSDVHRILSAAAVAAVGVAFLTLLGAVVQLPTEPRTIPPRTFGPVTMPVGRVRGVPLAFGILGMFLLYPAPYLAVRGWRDRSLGALGGVGGIVLAVGITQSRSTYLALAAAIGVLAVTGIGWIIAFGAPRWRRRVGIASVLGGIASIPVALVGARILIAAGRVNFVRRLRQIRQGLSTLLARPLFGTGPDQFQSSTGAENVIHAAPIRLGAESGLPTLVAFLAAVYLGVRQLVRTAFTSRHRSLAVVVAAGAAAVAVEAVFQSSFGRPTWVVLALAVTAPWSDDVTH